jgi:16S rRNA (adenine1518-N6/adenine1519-N6)-dimethyltransferase
VTDGLLGPVEVRELAGELDLRPTKTLGQNFVIDPNTVRRIAERAHVTADDVVLEVGPGLGSLTLALLDRAERVIAVEIDDRLAQRLPRTVAERRPDLADRLEVINADAMRITDDMVVTARPTAIVANLPYNVAVPVLLHLLATLDSVRHGLVMVQSEVADRLAAEPGSRTYGVPSVKMRWFADVSRAGSVSASVFWPAPRVESGLVAFTRHPRPATTSSREQVFTVIDAAFAQRRKTMRAALAGWAGSAVRAEELLRMAGIDPMVRGEQLGIDAFIRLAEAAQVV